MKPRLLGDGPLLLPSRSQGVGRGEGRKQEIPGRKGAARLGQECYGANGGLLWLLLQWVWGG